MTKTEEKVHAKGEIHSSCVCMWCPKCEMTTEPDEGYKCPECGDEMEYSEGGCWDGFCYEYAKEDFENFFNEWAKENNADYYAIYGSNMGWLHKSGHTGRLSDFDEVYEMLTIDSDFTLYWKLSEDKKTLSVSRSSHDEYGAYFEVRPWNEGDDE
jgi:hypothetical protein